VKNVSKHSKITNQSDKTTEIEALVGREINALYTYSAYISAGSQ